MTGDLGEILLWQYMQRVGKRYFIWHFSVLRMGVPVALGLATMSQLRENTGVFTHDVLSFFGMLAVYLAVGVPIAALLARRQWARFERRFGRSGPS